MKVVGGILQSVEHETGRARRCWSSRSRAGICRCSRRALQDRTAGNCFLSLTRRSGRLRDRLLRPCRPEFPTRMHLESAAARRGRWPYCRRASRPRSAVASPDGRRSGASRLPTRERGETSLRRSHGSAPRGPGALRETEERTRPLSHSSPLPRRGRERFRRSSRRAPSRRAIPPSPHSHVSRVRSRPARMAGVPSCAQ